MIGYRKSGFIGWLANENDIVALLSERTCMGKEAGYPPQMLILPFYAHRSWLQQLLAAYISGLRPLGTQRQGMCGRSQELIMHCPLFANNPSRILPKNPQQVMDDATVNFPEMAGGFGAMRIPWQLPRYWCMWKQGTPFYIDPVISYNRLRCQLERVTRIVEGYLKR